MTAETRVPAVGAILTAAAGVWTTALVVIHVPAPAGIACLSAFTAALLLSGLLLRRAGRRRSLLATTAIVLALAGAVAGHVALAEPARARAGDLAVDGGRALSVSGVVSSKIERSAVGLRFDLDAHSVHTGPVMQTIAAPVTVRVAPGDVLAGLDLGSEVVVTGTARAADAGDRSVLVVFASRGVEVRHPPPTLLSEAAALRQGFLAVAATLPGAGGDLLPGLAVGDTSAVTDDLDASMKASSLSHLTAVSGANCAIVVALAYAAASACRLPRPARIATALVCLGGFVVLVTPEPSVLRAATMAAIALIALALDRPVRGMGVLAVAVIVALIADPWLAATLGFALSVAATAGLLLLTRPLTRGLARIMPGAVAAAVAVPLAAQLACGPLLILIDPAVPLYGVVANMIAGPAAPAATVLGLAACLVQMLPPVAQALAWVAWVPAAWIAGVAETFAVLPGARAPWLEGIGGALALLAAGAAVALVLGTGGARWRVPRVASALALAALLGAGAGHAVLSGPLATLRAPQTWSIAQCDVGQGDAVLVRSGDVTMLVDTGPEPDALHACLSTLGIASVDLLVLTHFDADHVGAADILRGRVGTVMHGPAADAEADAVLRRLAGGGAHLVAGTAGMTGTVGAERWRVHWPRAAGAGFDAGNDSSVVLEIGAAGGAVPRTLLLGDLSESAQRALMAQGSVRGAFDVVKVAHHGSADQAPELYRTLDARVALIGVGADNDYGHPRATLLTMLSDEGMSIGRSDTDGLVLVGSEEGELRVWRQHPRG
ncbi:MAG: competence protein ComEC [Microbacterium sp.]|uniref:ComEC/Rec2 family competence protein n=1 Tax=Microbacterium sp. TaxID=51671 RepID=UPI000DB6ECDB|nr:ComEC/Rec2 family competence protein [Microbacterium sp.]PZU39419.1 MAG: competence protein ComEC [Microbacterium sp.]